MLLCDWYRYETSNVFHYSIRTLLKFKDLCESGAWNADIIVNGLEVILTQSLIGVSLRRICLRLYSYYRHWFSYVVCSECNELFGATEARDFKIKNTCKRWLQLIVIFVHYLCYFLVLFRLDLIITGYRNFGNSLAHLQVSSARPRHCSQETDILAFDFVESTNAAAHLN